MMVLTEEQEVALMRANYEYLANAKHAIFELYMDIRDEFDGSDYMQGKKDGLRLALTLLGNTDLASFNRGGSQARGRDTL